MHSFDYTIVGAGPAGLAAAGHIAATGATVCVLERGARPENVFGSYPLVLNARGMDAIERLSGPLAEQMMATGIPVTRLNIMPNNKIVAAVEAWGTGIMRDQAAELLLQHAEAQPNITFLWEHKFVALDIASRAAHFERPDGSQVRQTVGRLVAADGNRSRVRAACCSQLPDFFTTELPWGFYLRFMVGRAKPGSTIDPGQHYVLGERGYFCAQPDGRWSVALRVLPGDPDFLTAKDATPEHIRALREYTEQHAALAAAELLDDDAYATFYDSPAFDGLCVKLDRLAPTDWIAVIGDASHAPMPATGEGINSGLEDAAVLGDCVREFPGDPFVNFDARHRANTHALHEIALAARDLVVAPPPRQRATNVMVTIGLAIAKSMHIVNAVKYDYMLGAKARTQAIKSYADIVALEKRQTTALRAFSWGVLTVLRVPKANPDPELLDHTMPLLRAAENLGKAGLDSPKPMRAQRWKCWQ